MAALQRFDDGIKQGWQMVFQILVRKAEALLGQASDPRGPSGTSESAGFAGGI